MQHTHWKISPDTLSCCRRSCSATSRKTEVDRALSLVAPVPLRFRGLLSGPLGLSQFLIPCDLKQEKRVFPPLFPVYNHFHHVLRNEGKMYCWANPELCAGAPNGKSWGTPVWYMSLVPCALWHYLLSCCRLTRWLRLWLFSPNMHPKI